MLPFSVIPVSNTFPILKQSTKDRHTTRAHTCATGG